MNSEILGKTVSVSFGGGVLVLKKLPLGRIEELGSHTAGLFRALSPTTGLEGAGFAERLGSLYSESPKRIAALASVLTGLPEKVFLDAEDPDEVLEIVSVGYKLNNVMGMFSNALKKVMGTEAAQAEPQA